MQFYISKFSEHVLGGKHPAKAPWSYGVDLHVVLPSKCVQQSRRVEMYLLHRAFWINDCSYHCRSVAAVRHPRFSPGRPK